MHAALCDELLGHYSSQWADRQVYWKARDRSCIQRDMVTVIIDSFDRSKVSLPKWPLNRTPKRTVYELHLRPFTVTVVFFNFHKGVFGYFLMGFCLQPNVGATPKFFPVINPNILS